MEIVEVTVKKSKKQKDMIIAALSDEDFELMKEQALTASFRTGVLFVCHESRLEDMLEIIKSI